LIFLQKFEVPPWGFEVVDLLVLRVSVCHPHIVDSFCNSKKWVLIIIFHLASSTTPAKNSLLIWTSMVIWDHPASLLFSKEFSFLPPSLALSDIVLGELDV
jgi:hypothetical protein